MRLFLGFLETTNRTPHGRRCRCAVDIRPAGHHLLAWLAVPDAGRLASHCLLAAEAAGVFAVLSNFHLLDVLPQRRAVTRSVLADDANLLRALGHFFNIRFPIGVIDLEPEKERIINPKIIILRGIKYIITVQWKSQRLRILYVIKQPLQQPPPTLSGWIYTMSPNSWPPALLPPFVFFLLKCFYVVLIRLRFTSSPPFKRSNRQLDLWSNVIWGVFILFISLSLYNLR